MEHQLKHINATENGYNYTVFQYFNIHSCTSIFVFIFVSYLKNMYLLASKYFLFQSLFILDKRFKMFSIKILEFFKWESLITGRKVVSIIWTFCYSHNNISHFKLKQEQILLRINLIGRHMWFVANTVTVSAIYLLIVWKQEDFQISINQQYYQSILTMIEGCKIKYKMIY